MPSDDPPTPEPKPTSEKGASRYVEIIRVIFDDKYTVGALAFAFDRTEIEKAAARLGIELPKNLGDVVYSFRYRTPLPQNIRDRAPEGREWVIRPAGKGKYRFSAVKFANIQPTPGRKVISIPDGTPGIIERYAKEDEQALLAKIRYNRLIDVFTGVTCYSLQSHYRTTVPDLGQVETDEVYVGLDKRGAHYVLPVQAKRGNGQLGIIQVESDIAMCAEKFPDLICTPIGAQFLDDRTIALFQFEMGPDGVSNVDERHYRLIPANDLTPEELASYRTRPE
jgi:hypothetical protein